MKTNILSSMLIVTTTFTTTLLTLANQDSFAGQNQISEEVINANNAFGIDLYHQLATGNNQNLFFSPYSINNALIMTVEGARNETALEMGKVLRFPHSTFNDETNNQTDRLNLSTIFDFFTALNQRFTEEKHTSLKGIHENKGKNDLNDNQQIGREVFGPLEDPNSTNSDNYEEKRPQIFVSNALWGEQTYPFKSSYIETINEFCKINCVFQLDFKSNHKAARQRINLWVEDQTKKRVQNLIAENMLSAYTRLVLTNAVYFKGKWASEFEERATEEGDFTLSNGVKVKTLLMWGSKDRAKYAAFNADGSFFKTPYIIKSNQKEGLYPDNDGFSMVELPYKGEELSMVLITPNSPSNYEKFERKITLQNLDQWLTRLAKREVWVTIPKLKLEASYNLNHTLQAMGMVRAFTSPEKINGAQFYGMTKSKNPLEQLYISKVVHKTFIEINEKETEAAAATAVEMSIFKGAEPPPEEITFVPRFEADRPFVFLIRDMITGTIIFLGRVLKPDNSWTEPSKPGSDWQPMEKTIIIKPTLTPVPVRP